MFAAVAPCFERTRRCALSAAVVACTVVATFDQHAGAQIVCNSALGPDLAIAEMTDVHQWGTVGNATAYSFGVSVLNAGDTPVQWIGNSTRHPVFVQNIYRLSSGRFEQIGMGWAAHGTSSFGSSVQCVCPGPGDGSFLDAGCSDAFDAVIIGGQASIGPRSEINPLTGAFSYPHGSLGVAGNATFKRVQVRNGDLNPSKHPGAMYFAETIAVAPDDAESGNALNNATWMPVSVDAFNNGGYALVIAGAARATQPAIFAWREVDPTVMIEAIDVPGDGRFYLASKVTALDGFLWQYEYAVLNFNSDRGARIFRVAVPPGVQVRDAGFSDVHHHSGEPFEGADWKASVAGGWITWNTHTFANRPNANALRWGTMYNFRFIADAPPGDSVAGLGLFGDGSPKNVNFASRGPVPGIGAANDFCGDAIDVQLGATLFSNIDCTTDGPAFPCEPADGASRDVWFRFTPTFTGKVRVSTCGSADFNTILSVYRGCDCSQAALASPFRCSDDACGTDARVNLNVVAGECYLIRVAGANWEAGTGMLRIDALDADNAIRADVIFTGESAGDRFGQSVAGAGDFNNNGFDDVMIGAHLNDSQASNAGRVQVRMGGAFAASTGFSGENAGDQFGRVVAGGCDFDGDGYADILIGAPLNDENGVDAGKVYCFSGFDNTLLWIVRGQLPGDRMGWAIACVGDVNGDGVSDVLIGAPFNSIIGKNVGRAYLVAGQDGSVIEILNGASIGGQFGSAVAALGDVDDDGFGDFAVAAPRARVAGPSAGRVTVFSGLTATPLQIIEGNPGDRLGSALAGLTLPIGAQTRTYLAVGAPNSAAGGANAGQVRLFMRVHERPKCSLQLCPTITVNGESAGSLFGSSLALGDVIANELPEIIVGTPGAAANGKNSGAVSIISSANGAVIRRITGETIGDALGTSVAFINDVTGDGKGEVLIGAPLNDAGGTNAGRGYVFLSGAASLARSPATDGADPDSADDAELDDERYLRTESRTRLTEGLTAEALMMILANWGACRSVACPGDVNGDGRVDASDLAAAIAGLRLQR